MGRPKLKEKKIPKTISLLPKHVKYIEENALDLSAFVRKKLDEIINKKNE